jgi:hypothetical protein
MLASAAVITILYIHVALVLFGILTTDGGKWRLQAPTRKRSIRDFLGRFSWGRLHRPDGAAIDQSIDASTGVSVGKKSTTLVMSASSKPLRRKSIAIKMLWYPTGMCPISVLGQDLTNSSQRILL